MLQQLNDTSAGGPSANDDTWPPGAVDLNRAADLHITRDHYLEAESRGLSLSELLETDAYDPTPSGSPLDAFERQLAVHGIRTGRARSSTVELFYSQAPALLPEFMRREIQRGQSMRPEIARLVASTSSVSDRKSVV